MNAAFSLTLCSCQVHCKPVSHYSAFHLLSCMLRPLYPCLRPLQMSFAAALFSLTLLNFILYNELTSESLKTMSVPFLKWKQAHALNNSGPTKVQTRKETQYREKEQREACRGETERTRKQEERTQGTREKRQIKAFDKIPEPDDSLLYICVSGMMTRLHATVPHQCSLAKVQYVSPYTEHNLRLTPFASRTIVFVLPVPVRCNTTWRC